MKTALLSSLTALSLFAVGCMSSEGGSTPTNKENPDEHEPGCGGLPTDARVLTAGWSFGECGGLCKGDLTFEGPDLTLTLTSWDPSIPSETYTAHLSAAMTTELYDAAMALDGVSLQSTYGCPDCADGGASHVELDFGGDTTFVSTYQYGEPPAELATVDGLVAEIKAAFDTCTSTERVALDGCHQN